MLIRFINSTIPITRSEAPPIKSKVRPSTALIKDKIDESLTLTVYRVVILQSQGSASLLNPFILLVKVSKFHFRIQVWNALPNYVCKRYYANAGAKLLK